MTDKNYVIGMLTRSGYLQTENRDMLLSTISPQAAQSPDSAPLHVDSESQGKIAIVRGYLDSGVLYSAEIVEVWPRIAGSLYLGLMEKGVFSASDIQNHLDKINAQAPVIKKLCALVIGHKNNSPGAENAASGINEFSFNEKLAQRIEEKVEAVQVQRVYRRTWETLPGDINELNPHFIISLHCNAFNKTATGTEVLYYHKSQTGKRIAEILQHRLVECLGLHDRGIKPKTAEDRGGLLLHATNAPCIIAEPFFIDNDQDLARAQDDLEGLSNAYATAIRDISEIV